MQEGAFVVVDDPQDDWTFYGLITDLQLWATDPRYAQEDFSGRLSPRLAKLLRDKVLFTNAKIMNTLMMERGPDPATEMEAYLEWFQGVMDERVRPSRPRPSRAIMPPCGWPGRKISP